MTDKLAIEEHLVLSATAPWVDTPDLLLLHHNGRRYVQCSASLHPMQPTGALKRTAVLLSLSAPSPWRLVELVFSKQDFHASQQPTIKMRRLGAGVLACVPAVLSSGWTPQSCSQACTSQRSMQPFQIRSGAAHSLGSQSQ